MNPRVNIFGTMLVVWISAQMVQPGNRAHAWLLMLTLFLANISLIVNMIILVVNMIRESKKRHK